MATQKYIIGAATAADAAAMTTVQEKAFAGDPFHSIMCPPERAHLTPREELFAWRVGRMQHSIHDLSFKVTPADAPDQIVAYAQWFRPGHFAQKGAEDRYANVTFPACMDAETTQACIKQLVSLRKEIFGDDTSFWYLGSIAVDPAYQRQGIASMLMRIGTEKADEDGAVAYLTASPQGRFLYAEHGFVVCGDEVRLGGKAFTVCMVREPKPRN